MSEQLKDNSKKRTPSSILSVSRPRASVPTWALVALAGALGALIFIVLASQRNQDDSAGVFEKDSEALIASPPPLALPAERRPVYQQRFAVRGPYPAPAVQSVPPPQPVPPPAQTASALVNEANLNPAQPQDTTLNPPGMQDFGVSQMAEQNPYPETSYPGSFSPPAQALLDNPEPLPALIHDRGVNRRVRTHNDTGGTREPVNGRQPGNPEESNRNNYSDALLRATEVARGPYILSSGTMVPAVLQTPIDTARAGPVRAMVSQNVLGSDGRKVLIPKGATFLGSHKAGAGASGQRVQILWERLLLPDGRQVKVNFPATDANGASGVNGKVHSNAAARFAGSLLQSALNIATFGLLSQAGSDSIYVNAATPAPPNIGPRAIRRRITVRAGSRVNVFVTQPIDFSKIGVS